MKLNVLTACSRPENLDRISESVFAYRPEAMQVNWLVRLDPVPAVGGQRVKNDLIDMVTDGWVVILDDDTVMHPDFKQRIQEEARPDVDVIFFGQERPRTGVALPEARRGLIDAGQACFRRSLVGQTRIPDFYDGDGWFLETLAQRGRAIYLSDVLSFYNQLAD